MRTTLKIIVGLGLLISMVGCAVYETGPVYRHHYYAYAYGPPAYYYY